MNKIILDELKKVKSIKIDYTSNKIFIPRTKEIKPETLSIGNVYLLELNSNITNPSTNSSLAANWNAGKVPKYSIYKAEIVSVINDMIKVNAIPVVNGNDVFTENFYGWLPKKSLTIIEKL